MIDKLLANSKQHKRVRPPPERPESYPRPGHHPHDDYRGGHNGHPAQLERDDYNGYHGGSYGPENHGQGPMEPAYGYEPSDADTAWPLFISQSGFFIDHKGLDTDTGDFAFDANMTRASFALQAVWAQNLQLEPTLPYTAAMLAFRGMLVTPIGNEPYMTII